MIRESSIAFLVLCAACLPCIDVKAVEPSDFPGIVLDNVSAELVGDWTKSTSTRPFIGVDYLHDGNKDKGAKSATYSFNVPKPGKYFVLVGYTAGTNRDRKVPVEVQTAAGSKSFTVDQTKSAQYQGVLHLLGELPFEKAGTIVVSNRDTKQHVIVDSVAIMTADQLKQVKKTIEKAEKAKPKPTPVIEFVRQPASKKRTKLTNSELDSLLAKEVPSIASATITDDSQFLCRASLDVIGRQPSVEELEQFVADTSPNKRELAIDRLLASPEFGANWANYWSDAIGSRQMEPELTFHNYKPFKSWLAEQINTNKGWDETVFAMLTASGKVGERPSATFIGFHQGNANRIAGEMSRVMLGVRIACAECHDHPFIDMPQETFHGIAAFFARVNTKIPQLNSDLIEISSKPSGEQKIPGKSVIDPFWFEGDSLAKGADDIDRRTKLAYWTVAGDNPFFAKAHVNRVWGRLIGRGFAEPVDDLGEDADIVLPEIFAAVSDHYIASDFSDRELMRLIMNTSAYQRRLENAPAKAVKEFAAVTTKPLRGDEVFDSLVRAVGLENVTPPRAKKTGAVRFPPPPKSTRDLVNQAFGYDPSFPDNLILRTMKQAMFLMNNQQIQDALAANATEKSFLSSLLEKNPEDDAALVSVYQHVLARRPTDRELQILKNHLASADDRTAAFEDILWSLINSAEFTSKR